MVVFLLMVHEIYLHISIGVSKFISNLNMRGFIMAQSSINGEKVTWQDRKIQYLVKCQMRRRVWPCF